MTTKGPPFAQLETAVADARGLLSSLAAHALLDHWAGLATQGYPTRRKLDPLAFAATLPNVWLRSYEQRTRRFQCVLAGDAVREAYDTPVVGAYLEDILQPGEVLRVRALFERALLEGYILVLRGRLFPQIHRPGLGERLVLPLYDDDGTPSALIGCVIPLDGQEEPGPHDIVANRTLTFIPLRGGVRETLAS